MLHQNYFNTFCRKVNKFLIQWMLIKWPMTYILSASNQHLKKVGFYINFLTWVWQSSLQTCCAQRMKLKNNNNISPPFIATELIFSWNNTRLLPTCILRSVPYFMFRSEWFNSRQCNPKTSFQGSTELLEKPTIPCHC